jgi:hypothetical protein
MIIPLPRSSHSLSITYVHVHNHLYLHALVILWPSPSCSLLLHHMCCYAKLNSLDTMTLATWCHYQNQTWAFTHLVVMPLAKRLPISEIGFFHLLGRLSNDCPRETHQSK